MNENKKESNNGCWKPILVIIIGMALIASPLNPFFETKSYGGEDRLTASSWLISTLLVAGLVLFVARYFGNKR